MMNDRGKSDRSIVPEKLPNNADSHAAEAVEGRDRAKGNLPKRDKLWTQHQDCLLSALARYAGAAGYVYPRLPCVLYPRQEPDMGNLFVRIRAGGGERSPSLPRQPSFKNAFCRRVCERPPRPLH
jgi:hypothetical protein